MYLKSILPTTASVTLAVAPDEPETAPTDPGSGAAHPHSQLLVLSLREWNQLNRALERYVGVMMNLAVTKASSPQIRVAASTIQMRFQIASMSWRRSISTTAEEEFGD